MENLGILVLFHAKTGKRDEIRKLWERYVKDHAASSEDLYCSMYNYGLEDENLIVLYEIMKDDSVLAKAFQEPWFQDYMLALETYLEQPPQIINFKNIWSKNPL